MSEANKMQVGGNHYRTDRGIQHWDLMAMLFGPAHFMCTASKYLTRWSKKNGVEDLEKAEHYVAKLLELVAEDVVYHNTATPLPAGIYAAYVAGNEMPERDALIVQRLLIWKTEDDLEAVLASISALIKEHRT